MYNTKYILDNCSYLIDQYGFMPNANRTYYLTRSQPPVYSLMVRLVTELDSSLKVEDFLPFLEKEYRFWMDGSDSLTNMNSALKRVVLMPHGEIMNRYWDSKTAPRPEAFRQDLAIESKTEGDSTRLYRNIRAACESGWDFSSRWLGYTKSFATMQTTEIIPVDLNCLLYHLEIVLSEAYLHVGQGDKAEEMAVAADYRKNGILKYCWVPEEGFFMDYAFWDQYHTGVFSLAGVFPMFFEIATDDQVLRTVEKLENDFLKEGGLVTTLSETGEQWDSPNGWAPLQYVAVEGLRSYQYEGLADDVIFRWTNNVNRIYEETGKILEKYNVVDIKKPPVGGEYPLQDGFGWTNAVFLKLMFVEE
ncbi:MAG: trehalase family glycosidase [Flammeovirgaceae bacterium]